ncbi:MAG: hypothetical protein K2L07_00515 [Lachnospiraceae bacterium]|nr:hypothetical protein [Lachnospiraceae bacterium]
MGMEISNSYSSYLAQSMTESSVTGSTTKKEAEKTSKASEGSKAESTSKTSGSSKAESTTDYMNKLKKLAPSVEFRTGYTHASDKSGKTLTINPKLLEKMQNDPEMEKEMKELIAGVEKMTKISESFNKANGWTTVYRHSYIDENGQYCHIAVIRNDHMLNMSDKLREERRKNSEKLMKKQKEKATKKKEELEKVLEKKKEVKKGEKAEEKTGSNKVETLLSQKIAASDDGIIYVDDSEFKTMLEAMKEDSGKTDKKEQTEAGAYLDLKV